MTAPTVLGIDPGGAARLGGRAMIANQHMSDVEAADAIEAAIDGLDGTLADSIREQCKMARWDAIGRRCYGARHPPDGHLSRAMRLAGLLIARGQPVQMSLEVPA